MTVTGPWWAWLLWGLVFLAGTIGGVAVAVEWALKRRLGEIMAMFGRALDHARSFDGMIEKVRNDRTADRQLLTEEVVPRLAKLEEKSIEHSRQIELLQDRTRMLRGTP